LAISTLAFWKARSTGVNTLARDVAASAFRNLTTPRSGHCDSSFGGGVHAKATSPVFIGMGSNGIAYELNRAGVPSPGARWNRARRRVGAQASLHGSALHCFGMRVWGDGAPVRL